VKECIDTIRSAVSMQESHTLQTKVMDLQEAKASGAIAMFGEKYDDQVRVVDVPGVSKELCGGTHVANTSEIGGFKIISEAGIASGVRRIEAVAGPSLMPFVNNINGVVRELTAALKVSTQDVPGRVAAMQKDLMHKEKQIVALRSEVALARSAALVSKV
jgi:alanyl-tRNA synthetase